MSPIVIFTVLVGILLAALLLKVGGRKRAEEDIVLLAGPSGAGKTALFCKWTNLSSLTFVPSREENVASQAEGPFATHPVKLVDLPGHPKLQSTEDKYFEDPSSIKAVVFVLDGSSDQAGIAEAAQRLFTLLLKTEFHEIPVLLAQNKMDLFNTLSVRKTTEIVESVIDQMRKAHVTDVGVIGKEEQGSVQIGSDGHFYLRDLVGPVEIIPGSVKNGQIGQWSTWLKNALSSAS